MISEGKEKTENMYVLLTLKLSNLLGPVSLVLTLTWALANKVWMLSK